MKYQIKDSRIIDSSGRHCIFNGINFVYKGDRQSDNSKQYIYDYPEEMFVNLRKNGINLVRIGIVWDGVEHNYQEYDQNYLDWIEGILDQCHQQGIAAFLDMHQDLYSVEFDGGAPSWATLTDGADHYVGEVWSDSYLFSDAVNTAYRNFWKNEKTEYGIGLQDHFFEMWTVVINRFKDHPALIGYDFLNEPFSGVNSVETMGSLLMAYCQVMNKEIAPDELFSLFSDDQSKLKLLTDLDNTELYAQVAKASKHLVQPFDENELGSFYQKCANLRSELTDHGFVLTENSYFSNMGIEAGTRKIELAPDQEPLQVFSPHGYDLVVDSPLVGMSSNQRIKAIFDGHKRVQKRLNVPVIFGEWGAHYKNSDGLGHIEYILNYFDQSQWSHTYFCWFEGIEQYPVFTKLSRPYPQVIAGEINNYHYDFTKQEFTIDWENGNQVLGESLIYFPTKPDTITANVDYRLIADPCGCYYLQVASECEVVNLTVKL